MPEDNISRWGSIHHPPSKLTLSQILSWKKAPYPPFSLYSRPKRAQNGNGERGNRPFRSCMSWRSSSSLSIPPNFKCTRWHRLSKYAPNAYGELSWTILGSVTVNENTGFGALLDLGTVTYQFYLGSRFRKPESDFVLTPTSKH
jgi:hypothetical protein